MSQKCKKFETVVFGDDGSPDTNKIFIEVGQPFRCPCGSEISTSDFWLAAHWDEETQTTCGLCGQLFKLISGVVKLDKHDEKWRKFNSC